MAMNKLSEAQLEACRDHPLAAYFAKKLPMLIAFALGLVAVSLVLAGITVLAHQRPESFNLDLLKFPAVAMLATVVLVGLMLAAELRWMHLHCISPEHFNLCQMPPYRSPPAINITHPTEPLDLRSTVNSAILALREESSRNRDSLHATNLVGAECQRSMLVLCQTSVNMLETLHKCLTDKAKRGVNGSGIGFKQLEISANALQRMCRQAGAGAKSLHFPRKKSCKS
jgi:hypothetical protein